MKAGLFLLVGFYWSATALAQGIPGTGSPLALTGYDTRSSLVPANSNNTLLTFTVEADATGLNTLDAVVSNPGVVISLILPAGSEITTANAATLGYSFSTIADSDTSEDIPSVFSTPGTHTVIRIPAGQPSGIYKIRADATNVASDSTVIATYLSSSSMRAASTTDSANYKVGDTVVVSALLFDGTTPVTGASITASVTAQAPIAAQATVGNYQLVSQQAAGPNLTDYEYAVTLTNAGPAEQSVQAELATLPNGVTVLDPIIVFGDVAANSSASGMNTVTIEGDSSTQFDPTTLAWNVTSSVSEGAVTLADSGSFDAAAGDGIYTGTFTATSAGVHTVVLAVTGTSLTGNSFSRKPP